ncbi:MAG: radical SAM protein [Defluviitaleaceae bacterium]|nr:radical SAM protein [Defluviitaleaceae bacterium]
MFTGPLQVDFDITLKCMYRCKHCNVAAGDALNDEMTFEQIKEVLNQLDDEGVSDVSITGGEPLLRKDCLDILEYASTKRGFFLTLNTNGLLLTPDIIKFFEEKCPDIHVCVSLDGYTPETYSILRQRRVDADDILSDEFNTVVHALRLLVRSKLKCSVNYTITKATLPYIYDTYDFIKRIGIKSILAIKFFPYGYGRQGRDVLELDYNLWSDFLMNLTVKKTTDLHYRGIQVSVTCPWEMYLPLLDNGFTRDDINDLYNYNSPLESELYRRFRSLGCHAGVTSCAISPNGDLYPCGTISAKFPPFICGNLKTESLHKIWNHSPVLKNLRSLDISELKGNCSRCRLSKLCGGGCRARAYVEYGDLCAKDYLCPIVD